VARTIAPLQRDPAETLQRRHRRGEGRCQRRLFDLPVALVAPLQLVREQGVVLAEHDAVRRRERGRLTR
jgi:hypothetical protein